LVAAWLGANSTPAINFTLLSWVAEARTFSHQARLGAEVAALLAGEESTSKANQISENSGHQPQLPPALVDTAFKRFDLALADRCLLPTDDSAKRESYPREIDGMSRWRAAPPHGPPRIVSVG